MAFAFATKRFAIARLIGDDVPLDLVHQLERLVKPHRETHSPGDRQLELGLAPRECVREKALPAKQREKIALLGPRASHNS
jgi:hypothetical protein